MSAVEQANEGSALEISDEQLWALLEQSRGHRSLTPRQILSDAKLHGINLDFESFMRMMRRMSGFGVWTYPEAVVSFVGNFAAAVRPRSVLDPFARYGELILAVNKRFPITTGVAFSASEEEYEVASILANGTSIAWHRGPSRAELEVLPDSFDLVVSCGPWNQPQRVNRTLPSGAVISEDQASLNNYLAIDKLSMRGRALLVVNSGFVHNPRPAGWFAQRVKLGITLEALVYVPARFFNQMTIDSYLCIFSKQPHDGKTFVGELSKSEEHNEALLANLLAHESSPDMSLGVLHEGDFPGFPQLAASKNSADLAKRMGVRATLLRDLMLEVNLTRDAEFSAFPHRDNAVYLPLIGRSRAADSTAQLTMKPQNYAQIVLNPSAASAAYIASYFNSPLGLSSRRAIESGSTIPKLTKQTLSLASVYIPDLKTQLECVALESRALNLRSEIDEVLQKLSRQPLKHRDASLALSQVNRDDSFDRWLDSLPFPLASVLWVYHASGNDDKARYEHLLHFFEALAEFMALILWSALETDERLTADRTYPLRIESPLNYSVRKSSFGSWIEIAARLAKYIRTLRNSQASRLMVQSAFGDSLDVAPFDMLCGTSLITALESANTIRNRKGHGGIVGIDEARQRRTELESILAGVRASMGSLWLDFPLYRAGAARYQAGMFNCEVERVMGRPTPFERVTVALGQPVEDGRLFLLASGSNKPVPLAPLLVIAPSPRTAQNACYFYNSQSGAQLRFVSYHFDQEAELLLSDQSSTAALLSLVSSTG